MTDGASWGPGSGNVPESLSDAFDGDSGDSSGDRDQSPGQDDKSHSSPSDASEKQSALYDYESPRGTSEAVMEPGEYRFLPVFGFNEAQVAVRKFAERSDSEPTKPTRETSEPLEIGGKDLSWWEDSSIIPRHPYMLVNPVGFNCIEPEDWGFRQIFRYAKGEQFAFSDSGGYQLMSVDGAEIVDSRGEHRFNDYQVHPETLLDWQVANADAGATIDYPPYNVSENRSFPDAVLHTSEWAEFFDHRKGKSAEMTKRMACRLSTLRERDDENAVDYIFSPVIHGKPHPHETHHYTRGWHRAMEQSAVSEGVEPRGWVLKPEPAHNVGQIAMFLGYAEEHLGDADYIHVLMVGGFIQKALLVYYAMGADHFVTSDASGYTSGGRYRQAHLPTTATRRSVIISSRGEDDDGEALNPNSLTRYPCRCPACSTVEQELGFEFIADGSGSTRCASLNLHNLHQELTLGRTIDALLREEDATIVETGGEPAGCEFWRYLNSVARPWEVRDLYRAMDYVRIAREESLDAAERAYTVLWDQSERRTITRGQQSGAQTAW